MRYQTAGAGMRLQKFEERTSTTLVSIQALRAIAALMVLSLHVSLQVAKLTPTAILTPGAAGVDLFFVISGFVMLYSSERLLGRPWASAQFFKRRLLRIVPLYWLATTALVLLLAPFAGTKAVIASLLFWPYPAGGAPLLNVGWTLNIEMFFYLAFAAALLAKSRVVVTTTVSIFLLGFAWLGPTSGGFSYLSNPIIIEFVFGMMIALAYRAGIRLAPWATIGLLVSGLTLYVATFPDAGAIPRQFSWGIPAALIVAAVALSRIARATTPAIGIIVFFGDMSYALYLTHNITLPLIVPAVARLVQPVQPWLCGTAMFVVCVVIGAVTYLLLERPITRILQQLSLPERRPAHSSPGLAFEVLKS